MIIESKVEKKVFTLGYPHIYIFMGMYLYKFFKEIQVLFNCGFRYV